MISLLRYLQKTKWISRRDFLEMINEKAVSVDDNLVESINQKIMIWNKIKISLPNNKTYEETVKKIPTFQPIIVAFNKPKWYVVSKSDKFNKTIYELLPASWHKDFYYIGRLDKDSHWLLLLTNEPSVVEKYEKPKNKVIKIYETKIDKPMKTNHILKLKKWININEKWKIDEINWTMLSFYDVKYNKDKKWNHIVKILLTEGKNQQIRKALKALSYKILDLKRIKVWKYELGSIKPGKYMIHKIQINK